MKDPPPVIALPTNSPRQVTSKKKKDKGNFKIAVKKQSEPKLEKVDTENKVVDAGEITTDRDAAEAVV